MTESKEDQTVPQGEHASQTIAGMYLIMNIATGNMVDLYQNKRDDGASIVSYPYLPHYGTTAAHWDIRNSTETTYTIRNIWGGSVVGLVANKDKVLVAAGTLPKADSKDQQWILKDEGDNCYILQNAESLRVLEVKDASPEAKTPIIVVDYQAARDSQLWRLERRDRITDEVKRIVDASSILKTLLLAWPSGNIRFLTLPPATRNSIYEGSKIGRHRLKAGTGEPKDLAIKLKETIWTWAEENVGIEGYSFLFGIVCGFTAKGPKVYNWQLSQDLCEIVFIDPLSGRQYTSTYLQLEDFQSEWGTC